MSVVAPHAPQRAFAPASSVAPRGRFSANLLTNLGNFGLNIVVGVWFVPYLVRHLGIAGYGMIPLTTQAVACLVVVTGALHVTVGRYLAIALERADDADANRVFNTALFGISALCAPLLAAGMLLAANLARFFDVPRGSEAQAVTLCVYVVLACVLTAACIPFSVASFCRNRLDLQNLLGIGNTLVRVGLVAALFAVTPARVEHVGMALLAAAVFSAAGSVWVWHRLTPCLRVDRRCVDAGTLRPLLSTGGWNVVNQLGTVLFLSIDLIVVNRLFGAEPSGRYAALLQWSLLLRALAGSFAGVFTPTALTLYARGDEGALVPYLRRAVKVTGLVIALPVGLICGLSRPLLTLWLGPEYAPYAPLLSLMTGPLCVSLAVLPLFSIFAATNHVRLPGIVQLVAGAANLAFALLLAGPCGWGVYGVAAAGGVVLTLKNTVFTTWYGAKLLGLSRGAFAGEIAPLAAAAVGVALLCRAVTALTPLPSAGALIAAGALVSLVYAAAAYRLLLSPDERAALVRAVTARKKDVA